MPVGLSFIAGRIQYSYLCGTCICLEESLDDGEWEAEQILIRHTPRDEVARQYLVGRLQRILRVYFEARHSEDEDDFWLWSCNVSVPAQVAEVMNALEESRRLACISNDSRRNEIAATELVSSVLSSLSRVRQLAIKAFLPKFAKSIVRIIDKFANANTHTEVSHMNTALAVMEYQCQQPYVFAHCHRVKEIFHEVCADEASLKWKEITLVKCLESKGIDKAAVSGWLYPATAADAPQYLTFGADGNRELEDDDRWFYSADGTLSFPIAAGRPRDAGAIIGTESTSAAALALLRRGVPFPRLQEDVESAQDDVEGEEEEPDSDDSVNEFFFGPNR